jgi:hypothetical protein
MGGNAPFQVPGEDEAQIYVFEKFGTLNTKANRPAIKDEEFAWLMNWMPVGDANLRALGAEGSAIYTTSNPRTILNVVPFNFGATNYACVFLDNGTAVQVNLGTAAVTTITSTANLLYDSTVIPTATQWESKYLIIVTVTASSPNTYFIWDGTSFYQAGTLSPETNITNAGTGYTSAPTVTAFGGSGSGATFTATVANGSVTKVVCTSPGTGYVVTDKTIQLAFTGGGSDTSARAHTTVTTSSGGVGNITITNSGSGYTTTSTLSFSGGGGSGANAVITGLFNGAITQISITNPGTGYTSAPTIAASGGSGFTATVDIRYGQVASVVIDAGGSGYSANPQVVFSAPDSTSEPTLQAQGVAVISAGGVSSVTITEPGLGYITPPTITFVGGNNAAAGTVNLMPFGIAGTTAETYAGAVWVANGNKCSFTAPDSVSNFSTSAGGGSFINTNSFQRANYIRLIQTNGTLYLISDSSVDAISNVTTNVANGVSTTTFNNSNIDPQTGTPWRDSVTVFGRAVVFANATGIYTLFGGAAEKVSGPLDGLFANATFNTGAMGGITPISAIASLFSIRCFLFAFTTINPFTNVLQTMMAGWDGTKWFMITQINTMGLIATSEANSNLTAYGATATSLYPMLTTPSASLQKVLQTKLRPEPTLTIVKQVNRLYLTAETALGETPTIQIGIDTERGPGPLETQNVSGTLTFVGSGPITFVGSGPITWEASGLVVLGWTQVNYGSYIGLTGVTNAADMTILALAELYRPYHPRA